MNQREILMYDDEYKRSVLAIMNIIANAKNCYNMTGKNLVLYYKILEGIIIKDMENNKDIQKDSRLYKLIEKYLPSLVYGDIYFYPDSISYTVFTDMLYNTDNMLDSCATIPYNKIGLRCTISAKLCEKNDSPFTRFKDIEISPSLKILYKKYNNTCESKPLYSKNEQYYSFYQIYINIKNSLKDLIEDYNIKNTIVDIMDIEYLLQEMAMLITLFYMKTVVPIDDYSKFLELDEKKENISSTDVNDTNLELKHYSEIGRDIFNIESSLYEIGSIDLNLLKDTLKKINKIISGSKIEIYNNLRKQISV